MIFLTDGLNVFKDSFKTGLDYFQAEKHVLFYKTIVSTPNFVLISFKFHKSLVSLGL